MARLTSGALKCLSAGGFGIGAKGETNHALGGMAASLNFYQMNERRPTMNESGSKIRRNVKRRAPVPLLPNDALSMLRSAIGYVMESGLEVGAMTRGGALVIIVHGAQRDASGGFVVTTPTE